MDLIRKPTHLTQDEMRAVLSMIGSKGVRAAMSAWMDEKHPENIRKFRQPRGWVVLDAQGRKYAHQPLIALAYELSGQPALDPNNFGLPNDEVCKKWFDQEGIAWAPV